MLPSGNVVIPTVLWLWKTKRTCCHHRIPPNLLPWLQSVIHRDFAQQKLRIPSYSDIFFSKFLALLHPSIHPNPSSWVCPRRNIPRLYPWPPPRWCRTSSSLHSSHHHPLLHGKNHGGGNKVDLETKNVTKKSSLCKSVLVCMFQMAILSIKYHEISKNLAHHGLSPQKLLYYHWWPDSPCSPWRRQHLKQGSASEKKGCEVAVILEGTSEDQPSLIYIYIPFYSWCTNLYTLRKVDVRELILKLKQTQHVGGLHLTNPMLLYINWLSPVQTKPPNLESDSYTLSLDRWHVVGTQQKKPY